MAKNYTKIINSLPNSVPFVGPETQERLLDKQFDSRIGANESVFGPSPKALKVMKDEAVLFGCMETQRILILKLK